VDPGRWEPNGCKEKAILRRLLQLVRLDRFIVLYSARRVDPAWDSGGTTWGTRATPTDGSQVKKYGIREVFGTVQGEGAQSGTPAVFLRFAGCNLGYAVCPWCDTDWARAEHSVGAGGTIELIRDREVVSFGRHRPGLLVVATGGEPSLQLDEELAGAIRGAGYRLSMETNGSRPIPSALVDWLTVSPKQGEFAQRSGDELKIVYSGTAAAGPAPDLEAVERLSAGTAFDHYFLQPVDLPGTGPNTEETLRAVMKLGPPWRLSLQLHKVLGIP
jgi:7-carboxy-7-deazaguanine synthase